MAPPAKRRRRNVADDSDDDSDYHQDAPPRNKTSTGNNGSTGNTLANFLVASPNSPSKSRAPTESPSPVKPKLRSRTRLGSTTASNSRHSPKKGSPKKGSFHGDEKGKSADLKALFSKQAQRAPARHTTTDEHIEDLISDPISEDDDDISEVKASSSSLVGQYAKKRLRNAEAHPPSSTSAAALASSSSQRFRKPPAPPPLKSTNENPNQNGSDEDQRPWSERFGPKNLDELVVHKKKVADVRRWLHEVVAGRMRQRLLILKGPAGSAKTTTLRLLARDMGIEVLEWKNPANNPGLGFSSASAKFDEFLGRGGKFGALEMDEDEEDGSKTTAPASDTYGDHSRRLMMIEEFPNTFSRSSTALTSFRSSILGYLAAHVPSLNIFSHQRQTEPIKPIVMIISETLLTTTSAAADSFTAHRLLGPEILRHPGVGMIEFNAIAPTLLAKALDLVVQKEARKSGRRRTPGPVVLQRLGEIGDIRSAISSLEFLCLKGDGEADWGAKVAFTKQKKSVKAAITLTQGEADSLELISQREASLGIFHAVGRVVYNKRDEAPPAADTVEQGLPPWLAHHARPKRSQVSVDALIDETGTDTHTFVSALHENYAASCESTDDMDISTPMDYINDCIEALSESDLLCPSRDIFFGGRGWSGASGGSHVLRQDEIMFHVAVRGILFSLPNPVHRKASTSFKGSDAFKMFYPQSLKLWRAREEIEGMVDMWSSKMLRGEWSPASTMTKNLTDGASAFRRPLSLQQVSSSSSSSPSLIPSTQKQQQQAASRSTATMLKNDEDEDDNDAPLISLGSAARREMLLERLPYMAQIARGTAHQASRSSAMPVRLRDLEKVVAFKGTAAMDDEPDDDAEEGNGDDAAAPWATDKPSEESSPRKKRAAGIKAGNVTGLLAQKLVLSDDDIED